MQTKLSDFISGRLPPETLPLAGAGSSETASQKRDRDTDCSDTYPLRKCVSRSVRTSLQLLDFRTYNRHYPRSTFTTSVSPWRSFTENTSSKVHQVASASHGARTNEDGEPIISSVEIHKNCIADVVWDPKDEFLIATRRSRFQLFGTSKILNGDEATENARTPLLDLKTEAMRTRLGAENKISFGLVTAQFLGGTLNAICGYNGVSKIDVFDLEDVDEETGEPTCSFVLNSLFSSENENINCSSPATTAIVSLSATLAVAALSNGCSAFVDTRSAKPVMCTRAPHQSDIINSYDFQAGRARKRRCNTAINVVNPGCNTQIITGTKSGLVELWDLRRCDRPVAETSVGGSVETINCPHSLNSTRCGPPLVWLNTEYGSIFCISVGAASFENVSCIETKDTFRSHSTASLSPPKLSIMSQEQLLFYPHISSNTVLIYDIDHLGGTRQHYEDDASKIDSAQRDTLNVSSSTASDDFKSAHALLREQKTSEKDSISSLLARGAKQRSHPLFDAIPFNEWSYQIGCVSAAQRHGAVAVGGDDGDIHLLIGASP